jgi:hypothetical protein
VDGPAIPRCKTYSRAEIAACGRRATRHRRLKSISGWPATGRETLCVTRVIAACIKREAVA